MARGLENFSPGSSNSGSGSGSGSPPYSLEAFSFSASINALIDDIRYAGEMLYPACAFQLMQACAEKVLVVLMSLLKEAFEANIIFRDEDVRRFQDDVAAAIDSFTPLVPDAEQKENLYSFFEIIESAGVLLSADLRSGML